MKTGRPEAEARARDTNSSHPVKQVQCRTNLPKVLDVDLSLLGRGAVSLWVKKARESCNSTVLAVCLRWRRLVQVVPKQRASQMGQTMT